jgi:hypothetical protein
MDLEIPIDVYLQFFNTRSPQAGGGWQYGGSQYGRITTFRGPKFQRGYGLGSIFASLLRSFTPLFTKQSFKQIASHVGRRALTAGVNIGSDILDGANLAESAKKHATAAANDLLDDTGSVLKRAWEGNQHGEGIKRRKRALQILCAAGIKVGAGGEEKRKTKAGTKQKKRGQTAAAKKTRSKKQGAKSTKKKIGRKRATKKTLKSKKKKSVVKRKTAVKKGRRKATPKRRYQGAIKSQKVAPKRGRNRKQSGRGSEDYYYGGGGRGGDPDIGSFQFY